MRFMSGGHLKAIAGWLAAALVAACVAQEGVAQPVLSNAVNRLSDLQADFTGDNAHNGTPDQDPNDGGWDFDILLTATEHSIDPSPENTYGLTALGLIRAWKKVGRSPRVVITIADTANGMLARPEVDTGVDFAFLLLCGGFLGDPSYKPEARARWDAKIAEVGGPQALAESIKNGRHAQGLDGLIPWDINLWIMSAFFLEKSFPMQGYRQQGQIMAQVVFNDLFSVAPFFDKDDPNEAFYTLGLVGAHLGFRLTRQFAAEADVIRFNLAMRQNAAGWWSIDDGFPGPHIQSTAWAVTSYYLSLGDPFYSGVGQAGSNYLASVQAANGGWNLGASTENTEVDGEAILALSLFPPTAFDGFMAPEPDEAVWGRGPAAPYIVR